MNLGKSDCFESTYGLQFIVKLVNSPILHITVRVKAVHSARSTSLCQGVAHSIVVRVPVISHPILKNASVEENLSHKDSSGNDDIMVNHITSSIII